MCATFAASARVGGGDVPFGGSGGVRVIGWIRALGCRAEHRTMMLEWFDMYLKDQPEAWNDRWGD